MAKGHSNLLTNNTNLKMKFIRTPREIWDQLTDEFNFTVDACASDKNHLVDKYWTKDNDALKQDWDNEIIYCHPMYDISIPKFVKKAIESKCKTVFLLPASTNSLYFHQYFWDNDLHKPRNNVQIRFVPTSSRKGGKTYGYKFLSEDNEEPKFGYLRPLMIVVVDNL
jgi:phage N-6-adenine-methyltransferase